MINLHDKLPFFYTWKHFLRDTSYSEKNMHKIYDIKFQLAYLCSTPLVIFLLYQGYVDFQVKPKINIFHHYILLSGETFWQQSWTHLSVIATCKLCFYMPEIVTHGVPLSLMISTFWCWHHTVALKCKFYSHVNVLMLVHNIVYGTLKGFKLLWGMQLWWMHDNGGQLTLHFLWCW